MGAPPNRFAKGKPSSMSMAMRKKKAKQSRLTKIPQELKFFDTAVSFTPDLTLEVPATGQWALIPQGDTQSTRDGRQAVIKSIQFRGVINSGGGNAADIAYIWVVLDKQANGAAATAADVFTGTNCATCLINLNNNKRFRILHKEQIAPMTVGCVGDGTDTSFWPVEFFVPCNILMDWDSTAGAITEIKSNNIFIVAGSQNHDDIWTVTGNARLRFVG